MCRLNLTFRSWGVLRCRVMACGRFILKFRLTIGLTRVVRPLCRKIPFSIKKSVGPLRRRLRRAVRKLASMVTAIRPRKMVLAMMAIWGRLIIVRLSMMNMVRRRLSWTLAKKLLIVTLRLCRCRLVATILVCALNRNGARFRCRRRLLRFRRWRCRCVLICARVALLSRLW